MTAICSIQVKASNTHFPRDSSAKPNISNTPASAASSLQSEVRQSLLAVLDSEAVDQQI